MVLVAILFAFCVSAHSVKSAYEADRISSLPGQPPVNFRQYSGYVTVDEKRQRSYFYYFVEAETQPDSKPLVVWLNGGPGCSSIGAGAFSEHGPFHPNNNILVKNNYSWNKAANILYLESPAGVGFSYSSNSSFYQYVDDEMTARDNFYFLKNWLKKFPEFKGREFYLTGESYAGHYVPQLAQLLVQSKKLFDFKGIAIGNPLLDFDADFNSRGEFLWSHGLISDATLDQLDSVCNYSQIQRQGYKGEYTPVCYQVAKQLSSEMSRYIDSYDVTLDVCLSSVLLQAARLNQIQYQQEVDVCVEDEAVAYLNREDVHKALHARLVGVDKWSVCSRVLKYDRENLQIPTTSIVGSLVKAGIRVLVYSGDQDSVIPLLATRRNINKLAKQLGLNATLSYGAWFYAKQVAGWTQSYGDFLSYATIRGASHEAPFSQPERSYALFSSFVEGKQLPQLDAITKGMKIQPLPRLS